MVIEMRERTQFCAECGREEPYHIKKGSVIRAIRKKEYVFEIAEAVCAGCGKAVNIPGLLDYNASEIDRQYREQACIAGVQDIQSLMEVYRLGKESLSLALGFGEWKIAGYLAGQMPSREESEIIEKALESPVFMAEKLRENRERIGETAYKKAMRAAKEMEPLFSLSEKMRSVLTYLLKTTEEVTPLALQKMLYFIQGIYMALFDGELFREDCQAWAHGPVFKEVYEVFRSFRYSPIKDIRFSMFRNRLTELSDDEKRVIDLVAESLGIYSGKTLERITHKETPWKEARADCLSEQRSSEVITKESMRKYFKEEARKYDFTSSEGIREYIDSRRRTG